MRRLILLIKFSLTLLLAVSITSCTFPHYLGNCLDASLPRDISATQAYKISYLDEDNKVVFSTKLICERYYDGQCSARGNKWQWREQKAATPFITKSYKGHAIELYPPGCDYLSKGGNTDFPWVKMIDGKEKINFYAEDDGSYFRYISLSPREKEYINVPYSMKVEEMLDYK